jgi:FkbH-like protein
MRILKLVIWDLDETLLAGILVEGDKEANPRAEKCLAELEERGVLQALATQNQPEIIPPALELLGWSDLFVQVVVSLGPKAKKVKTILKALDINPLDTAFVDEDPFERSAIAAQIPGITAWSVSELEAFLAGGTTVVTEEGQRRARMYREQQARERDGSSAIDYETFLHSCNIQLAIRPYVPADAFRVEELLKRTHQMNLGAIPAEEAIARLDQPGEHQVIVAEMRDIYGDMGRCGVVHLTPNGSGEALIESLAISCRTRARGLSLAMLVGLLRHPDAEFQRYWCRYIANDANRPLRMLLMAAGFRPQRGTDWLTLGTEDLERLRLPAWAHLEYQNASRAKAGSGQEGARKAP